MMNPDKLQAEAQKDQFIALLIDSGAIPHIERIAEFGPADTDDDRELCKALACLAMGEICMSEGRY